MAQEPVVVKKSGMMELTTIIIIVILIAASAGGAYFFVFKEDKVIDDNGNNGGGNNTTNDSNNVGGKITATFTHVWDDDDFNGEVSVKEKVTFDASGSTGGDSYIWDFGEGPVGNTDNAIVVHYFSYAGIFNVTLNVSTNISSREISKSVTVTEVTDPAVTLNAQVEPEPIFGQRDTNITWRVLIQSASGSGSQMSTDNIRITLNRSGSNETYFSALVSELTPTQIPVTTTLDVDIYFADFDLSGTVSSGIPPITDQFLIAGNGGIEGLPVESGDVVSIWFELSGEMLDQVDIPASS